MEVKLEKEWIDLAAAMHVLLDNGITPQEVKEYVDITAEINIEEAKHELDK